MVDRVEIQDTPVQNQSQPQEAPAHPALQGTSFQSVEDMRTAWQESQRKITELTQPRPQENNGKAPEAAQPQEGGLEALMAQAAADYSRAGSISPSTQEALSKAGIPPAAQHTYLQGLQQQAQEIFGLVGGEEQYKALLEQAQATLSPGEIEAFNRTVDSGNLDAIKLAVSGLMARAGGREPNLQQGQLPQTAGGLQPFRSNYEVMEAMKDPRYTAGDDAYHQEVYKRLEISPDVL